MQEIITKACVDVREQHIKPCIDGRHGKGKDVAKKMALSINLEVAKPQYLVNDSWYSDDSTPPNLMFNPSALSFMDVWQGMSEGEAV